MKKNIVIVHYNTPLLTECLVRSINLFVKDAIIYIFDNSDKEPFTAFFDNVLVIDNTKGEIIDFDKWLEKYPNRHSSVGKTNNFASAKHCYSVEKCMEIIKENFILLDSDVLLKRDISDLYDEEAIYIGEVITQPKFNVKRVLPFICYINTEKCIENSIHYFDENHMYGLNKNKECEKYDTGSSFFLNTANYHHVEIKNDDYIVHYKAASWVDIAKRVHRYKQITISEWLKKYKKYWSNEKNKKVIYTCITGGYDNLLEPTFVSDGFDYICFTDNLEMKSDVWTIKPLPKETEGLSQVKKQRYVKINAHKVLGEYDLSIWVDGNVEIKSDLNKLLDKTLTNEISIYVPQHPVRNCLYKEADAIINLKKDKAEIVKPQIKRYEEEGFPKNYGLLQSNILIRKHNDEDCIKLMEAWFAELKDNSHRDQLSFNYVLWKNEDVKIKYIDKLIYKSQWFFWHPKHGVKINVTTKAESKPHKSIEELKEEFRIMMEERRARRKKVTTDKLPIYVEL